jgi:hypothetical protein
MQDLIANLCGGALYLALGTRWVGPVPRPQAVAPAEGTGHR